MAADDQPSLPSLESVRRAVLEIWPEHESFLAKSLPGDEVANLRHADQVAALILSLMGESPKTVIEDYRWTCERLLEEELYFRRNGDYRIKDFAVAKAEVYENAEFMSRYVNGLLLSHLLWANHRAVLRFFTEHFLPGNPAGFTHLEVGPGHGLFLHLAASHPACASALGWDISATSVEHTRQCLERLGAPQTARVERQDIMAATDSDITFDSVVISEVLEHLEDPQAALLSLKKVMAPNGRIFINVPVNSPAPDHIYLLETPEQAFQMIEDCGFSITDTACFPATGYSEERARKLQATLSCVAIATPAP